MWTFGVHVICYTGLTALNHRRSGTDKPEYPAPVQWKTAYPYLKEVEELSYSGAETRKFLECVAEVSEEAYRPKWLRNVIVYMVLVLTMCAAVTALI